MRKYASGNREHIMPTVIQKPPMKRILIADDYPDTVETWSQLLHIFHYEIDKAYDGRTALDVALAKLPAPVILDIGLPMIDGFTVARKLRENPELSNRVLIVHRGRCNEASFRRAEEPGFDYF